MIRIYWTGAFESEFGRYTVRKVFEAESEDQAIENLNWFVLKEEEDTYAEFLGGVITKVEEV